MGLFEDLPEGKKDDPNAITRDQVRQLEDLVGVEVAGHYMAYREQHKGIKTTKRAMNSALNKLRKKLDPMNAVKFAMAKGWSGLHGIDLKPGQHQRVPPFDQISAETREATRKIEAAKRADEEKREAAAAKEEKQGVTYTTKVATPGGFSEEEKEARTKAAEHALGSEVSDLHHKIVEQALRELE